MISYEFLLHLALILLATKALGMLTRRVNMPQVVGALVAGLVLGPAMLGVVTETEFITNLAEVGVIILMFNAGLETNLREMRKCGFASIIIALAGVGLPLLGGTLLAQFSDVGTSDLMQNIFIGVVLTATSVSITVETLKEMGKLNTKVSNTILGAALIDDILGIIVLTVISSLSNSDTAAVAAEGHHAPSSNIGLVLLQIVLFFVVAAIVGFVFFKLFSMWFANSNKDLRRYVIVALVFCLLFSYGAEEFFGVADITGAFIAGLILSGTKRSHYITARFETLSYLFLSPIFFASVGLNASIDNMSTTIIIFTVLLVIIAILTKVVGCGLSAKLCGFTTKESAQIGTGMVSRGEVALIVANKGQALGLVNATLFTPIIIMVVLTTILAPIMLKLAFRGDEGKPPSEDDDDAVRFIEGVQLDPYDGTVIER